ncbi:MAG: alpha-ribazole phosphatase [Pseudomonadota bacterium]
MQTLHLIRHTTPHIAPDVCYGQLDVDVRDSFANEAAQTLRWLPPVELILASPLRRTRRLGEHLGQARQCSLRSDARLMEKGFGVWEGKRWNDIPRHEVDAWAADILGYVPPGGESAQQLIQRVQHFLDEVAQLPQREIAIVAHAGSIRALLALVANIPLTDTLTWQIGYGAVIGLRLPV